MLKTVGPSSFAFFGALLMSFLGVGCSTLRPHDPLVGIAASPAVERPLASVLPPESAHALLIAQIPCRLQSGEQLMLPSRLRAASPHLASLQCDLLLDAPTSANDLPRADSLFSRD